MTEHLVQFSPDFLRHKATEQLVRQSLPPNLSLFWDKERNQTILKGLGVKTPPWCRISGAAGCTRPRGTGAEAAEHC